MKSSRTPAALITALIVGSVLAGAGAMTLSPADDVPRPYAPRADAIGPCADCDDQLLGYGLDAQRQSVTAHVTRSGWRMCPAGFRGAGRFGSDRRCASNTRFTVWSEDTKGLFRTPGLAPVAVCEIGEQKSFEVVAERGVHRGPVNAGNPMMVRNTVPSSCAQIRSAQPELAAQRFEVHQLSQVRRVVAETRDTASGKVVAAAHEIGQLRFQVAVAIGVEGWQ
ncbi:hypothetical protein [Tsukamurella pseudospumae]|nr:hypothetical protein [Tsukamurella pseudospumae]